MLLSAGQLSFQNSAYANEPLPRYGSPYAPRVGSKTGSAAGAGAHSAGTAEVRVMSGTPVRLAEAGEVLSLNDPVGKTVDFRVVHDVIINGWVVIASGARAQGHITNIKPKKINPINAFRGQQMPYMTIGLDWVTCADGRKLHVIGELGTRKTKVNIVDVITDNVPDESESVIAPGTTVDVSILGEGRVIAHERKAGAGRNEFAN